MLGPIRDARGASDGAWATPAVRCRGWTGRTVAVEHVSVGGPQVAAGVLSERMDERRPKVVLRNTKRADLT